MRSSKVFAKGMNRCDEIVGSLDRAAIIAKSVSNAVRIWPTTEREYEWTLAMNPGKVTPKRADEEVMGLADEPLDFQEEESIGASDFGVITVAHKEHQTGCGSCQHTNDHSFSPNSRLRVDPGRSDKDKARCFLCPRISQGETVLQKTVSVLVEEVGDLPSFSRFCWYEADLQAHLVDFKRASGLDVRVSPVAVSIRVDKTTSDANVEARDVARRSRQKPYKVVESIQLSANDANGSREPKRLAKLVVVKNPVELARRIKDTNSYVTLDGTRPVTCRIIVQGIDHSGGKEKKIVKQHRRT
jgi:hypothetical protein